MKPLRLPAAQPGLADIAILCLLGGVIATVVAFAREFQAPFAQAVQIDLRSAALPRYTLYSLSRGVTALVISYLFALAFGWTAAKSRAAERLLLPLLDILQSIPVLGFLPGLVLGLMSLFPTRNVGLELAAILMIFTAQAWNLALSFYNSLKALRSRCATRARWRDGPPDGPSGSSRSPPRRRVSSGTGCCPWRGAGSSSWSTRRSGWAITTTAFRASDRS